MNVDRLKQMPSTVVCKVTPALTNQTTDGGFNNCDGPTDRSPINAMKISKPPSAAPGQRTPETKSASAKRNPNFRPNAISATSLITRRNPKKCVSLIGTPKQEKSLMISSLDR